MNPASSQLNPEPAAPSPATVPTKRESLLRRFVNRFWGYDFFISYRWSSGGPYAVTLAERLRDRGYECFLDRAEFAVGDDWKKEGERALRNTHRLVVIATPEAIRNSDPVRHEVRIFTSRSHRVIPIVFGRRFTEDEREELRTLQLLSEGTIDIIEQESRLDLGPSNEVLEQLIQAHRLMRRRSVRSLVVSTALVVLATAAAVAFTFWGISERQTLLAQAAESVNESELLRETKGPQLEESLRLAEDAYAKSQSAGEPSELAIAAIEKARQLLPQRLGPPWLPFGEPVNLRVDTIGGNVFFRRTSSEEGEDFALLAQPGADGAEWRVIQRFGGSEYAELRDAAGEPISASANPRWFAVAHGERIEIWDLESGTRRAELPFKHDAGEEEGAEFLTMNATGEYALARSGQTLLLWVTAGASAKPERLPVEADYSLYAISPSGRWIAAARQNKLVLVRIKDGREFLRYPITPGGGHPESLGFVHGQGTAEDQALYSIWSANQIAGMGPAARRNAPSHQAAVWLIEKLSWSDDPLSVPDLMQVRENAFGISFSKDRDLSLAVLDPKNPVQWLDAESQISFALGGGFAGPGLLARFSPDNRRLLVIHEDKTARLWDLDKRTELLRFTSPNAIADAAFFQLPTSTDLPSVVTIDGEGRVQVWSQRPGAGADQKIR